MPVIPMDEMEKSFWENVSEDEKVMQSAIILRVRKLRKDVEVFLVSIEICYLYICN